MKKENSREFFLTQDWFSILKAGFNIDILSITINEDINYRVPVFHKGPFRIAYPGFPIGAMPENCDTTLIADILKNKNRSFDLLRLWCSGLASCGESTHKPSSLIPETVIYDLTCWSEGVLPAAVRRNLRKAKKSGLHIRPASIEDVKVVYSLYLDMIKKRKGNMRYNMNYFHELISVAQGSSHLFVDVAETSTGRVVSMIVTASHGGDAYYLHGATDFGYTNLRPADILMFKAISAAHDRGDNAFSFLPSPRKQDGLIRFKEKWGGKTQITPVYDYFGQKFGGVILKGLLSMKSWLNS